MTHNINTARRGLRPLVMRWSCCQGWGVTSEWCWHPEQIRCEALARRVACWHQPVQSRRVATASLCCRSHHHPPASLIPSLQTPHEIMSPEQEKWSWLSILIFLFPSLRWDSWDEESWKTFDRKCLYLSTSLNKHRITRAEPESTVTFLKTSSRHYCRHHNNPCRLKDTAK